MTAEPTDNFPDRALAEWFDAEIEERRGKVLLLRLGGLTYAQIASQLKISTATARKDYDIALAAHATDTPEKMIARQRSILTLVTSANLRGAMAGDKDSATTILKALDQEAKLFGLNAPTRILAAVNPVDYSNEAAQLLERIAQYDPNALDNLFRTNQQPRKELTRDRTQDPIDAEIEPADPVSGRAAVDPAGVPAGTDEPDDPRPDRDDHGTGEPRPSDAGAGDPRGDGPTRGDDGKGSTRIDGFDPDDDSGWADVD